LKRRVIESSEFSAIKHLEAPRLKAH
jgi:hypothetical protein